MTRRECITSLLIERSLSLTCAAAADRKGITPRIIEALIPFTKTRKDLTLQYIRLHYDPKATSIAITPKVIVVHWTAGGTAASALATFTPERLLLNRPELSRGGEVNVSAHFLVSQDGTIMQLMPLTLMARHVIGMNHVSIGIENVGGPDLPLTTSQAKANAALIVYLTASLPSIRYLIGHQESPLFRGTPLWKELMQGYQSGNIDPGLDFMERLRLAVAKLGLRSRYLDKS